MRPRGPLAIALAAALLGALGAPAVASASPTQFSILQDDAVLLGGSGRDPDAAMAEVGALGVDVVRTFVTWNRVAPWPRSRVAPAGFDAADPDSPGYDWSRYDALVQRARRNGLRVMFTIAPPMPYWGSLEPWRCPHRIGGYAYLPKSCFWKPDPVKFAQFAGAVARRYGASSTGPYGGQAVLYSIWNEPNLEHYLMPQLERSGRLTVDVAARSYRRLFIAAQREIARADPPLAGSVLFGETAAISSPMDTLYAALCLDPSGRPFSGRLARLQGCSRPSRLAIGGVAVHPYNNHASGGVFTRSYSSDSLPPPYLGRLGRLIGRAERLGRIPRGRGIYLTEAGFQSNPPDRRWGLSPAAQATALNQAERLSWADPRVRSIAQFELYDVPSPARETEGTDVYTTGLRYLDGTLKPAWAAFRMPLVVTRLSARRVEVWGAARPAPPGATVEIQAAPRGRGFAAVRAVRTGAQGYFRVFVTRPGAARMRWRIRYRGDPVAGVMTSRTATPGRRIRYLG